MTEAMQDKVLLLVGTYTQGQNAGIYVLQMDSDSGALTQLNKAESGQNPSFLAIAPSRRNLYAVSEVAEYAGRAGGAVCAFVLDIESANLTRLNQQPTNGASPCHLIVDKTGKFVLVANYGGGSVAVLPILQDGRLGPPSDFIQHKGSSVDAKRQSGPHAHSITPDLANRFVLAADLGLDRVLVYRLDPQQGKLLESEQLSVDVKAGAGPRHIDFHPDGDYAYLINELDSTIVAYAYEQTRGELTELQTVSTLPEGYSGVSHCADIHVHPSGRFVYGSNRGHDSIAIFRVAPGSGTLDWVGCEATLGKTPRNFAVDATGQFLLAANQDSDSIVVFRIDGETGALTAAGQSVSLPAPVCIKFLSSA